MAEWRVGIGLVDEIRSSLAGCVRSVKLSSGAGKLRFRFLKSEPIRACHGRKIVEQRGVSPLMKVHSEPIILPSGSFVTPAPRASERPIRAKKARLIIPRRWHLGA